MTNLKAKIALDEMGRPYTKEMRINENKVNIVIPLEEYKELLIYKGKYLGIIEKKEVE